MSEGASSLGARFPEAPKQRSEWNSQRVSASGKTPTASPTGSGEPYPQTSPTGPAGSVAAASSGDPQRTQRSQTPPPQTSAKDSAGHAVPSTEQSGGSANPGQQSSLFDTILSDEYSRGQSPPAGYDQALSSATLGMGNLDLRLDGVQSGQAGYVGQSSNKTTAGDSAINPASHNAPSGVPAQSHVMAGAGPLAAHQVHPSVLSFPGQAGAPSQYVQAQAGIPMFTQQHGAALLSQQGHLLQQPLLAQQALAQNVYGLTAGYPAPIKTPGAPIKTTDSDKGPEGCNLFVFHIPNDMTNLDLYQMFSTFGQVISARIMVDKVTGRSRGFGFVSYNNPESAEQAIKSMNGFVVGHKRLKVEQKKDKNTAMPSSAAQSSAAYYTTLQRWQAQLQSQAQAHLQAAHAHAHAHGHLHSQTAPAAPAAAHYLSSGLYNQP